MSPTPDVSTIDALTLPEHASIVQARSAAASVVAAAKALVVETPEQAERASEILRDLATVRNRAEAARKELTAPLLAKKGAIDDQFREPAAMLKSADGEVREKVRVFLAEQERIRAERQAAIDREAAEQRRRDEAEREERAAAARAQEERWRAEQAARERKAKRTGEQADAERAAAAKLAADALAEVAVAREIAPLPVRQVEQAAVVKPSEGIAVRRPWTFEVVDASEVPPEYLTVNEASIRRWMHARVKAGEVPDMSGVRFYQDDKLQVRGR